MQQVLPRKYRRSLALAFPVRWEADRPYRLASPDGDTLGPYYIDWFPGQQTLGEDWTCAPFDERGVILTPQGGKYHPVRIAQFGLHHHAAWLANADRRSHANFLHQARWLRDHHMQINGVPGAYAYDFPNAPYGADAGWISGMAQGEAISLLLRAAEVCPNDGYFEAALTAAQVFRHDVREGGVCWRAGKLLFFEEIAVAPATHILNGNIFAYWGLWDLHKKTGDALIGGLLANALETICQTLPLYDAGYWSYYDLLVSKNGHRKVAVLKYHAIHIAQLRVLSAMTSNAQLAEVANRWSAYVNDPLCRARMLANTLAGLPERFTTKADTIPGGAQPLLQ